MKAERSKNLFTPITLVIESQAELDYLYAISNSSVNQAKEKAIGLPGLSSEYVPDSRTQLELFSLISKFYK